MDVMPIDILIYDAFVEELQGVNVSCMASPKVVRCLCWCKECDIDES
jgi:hypothetical protein